MFFIFGTLIADNSYAPTKASELLLHFGVTLESKSKDKIVHSMRIFAIGPSFIDPIVVSFLTSCV